MNKFVVILRAEGHPKGLGSWTFQVPPQIGHFLTLNDNAGIGQVYKIVAILQPMDDPDSAGDIIVEHVGAITEVMKQLTGA